MSSFHQTFALGYIYVYVELWVKSDFLLKIPICTRYGIIAYLGL